MTAAGVLAMKVVVLAWAVAVLETRVAKLRLFRVPELLSASFRTRPARGGRHLPAQVGAVDATFSQLAMLGSSLMLIFGLILLWRRRVPAYINALHGPIGRVGRCGGRDGVLRHRVRALLVPRSSSSSKAS